MTWNGPVHRFILFVPMMKVLCAIVVGFMWSFVLKKRSDAHKKRHATPLVVKWWQQHTTPMYLILLATYLCELFRFWVELNSPADQQDDMFAKISAAPDYNHSENRSVCMREWNDEQTLDETHSLWVAQVAYLTPIFATLTFLVNAVFTIQHVRRADEVCLWDQTNRFSTLWILLLPVAYSVTALFSVKTALMQSRIGGALCMQRLHSGEVGPAFLIEAGLSFGDGYEAIALLLFADITFNVIENTVDKVVLDAESVKKALREVESAVDKKLAETWFPDKDGLRAEFSEIGESNDKVMRRLEQMSEKLMHSTWSLSILGIQYFAFTCMCIAIPQLLACQAQIWHMDSAFRALTEFSESWATTFKGMGLLGSCVAIHNMVSIEQNFDEAFLQGFAAKYKFVSVKIMVSIVFIQEMVLPVAFGLTLPRATLFDASLRIIEFTFISAFNMVAWPLDQDFYQMKAIDIEGMEDLQENLLEDGKLGSLSEKFSTMSSQKDLSKTSGREFSEGLS